MTIPEPLKRKPKIHFSCPLSKKPKAHFETFRWKTFCAKTHMIYTKLCGRKIFQKSKWRIVCDKKFSFNLLKLQEHFFYNSNFISLCLLSLTSNKFISVLQIYFKVWWKYNENIYVSLFLCNNVVLNSRYEKIIGNEMLLEYLDTERKMH